MQVQKFLTLPPDADAGLVRIAAELTKQNEEESFIPRFIGNYGYAAWEHSMLTQRNDVINYFIPLTDNSNNTVEALIQCIINKQDIRFILITKNNLDRVVNTISERENKPDQHAFKTLFRTFEHMIFGKPLLWVTLTDEQGNELGAYPAPEEKQPLLTKAYFECIPWEISVAGLPPKRGEHCKWIFTDDDMSREPITDGGSCWHCDSPDQGNSGGDGGLDWGDDPEPQPDEPKNPCDQLNNFLGTDTDFKNSMTSLANTVSTTNQELAWEMRKESYGNGYTYSIQPGIPNECEIPYYPSRTIDGFIHSHNSICISVFSISDLVAMYNWYKNGYIEDIDNFIFGVVTTAGAYMLKVEDINAFKKFGESALVDPGGRSSLEYLYFEFHAISNNKSNAHNELGFLRLLNSTNSGLRLYKSNVTDYSKWNKLSVTNNAISTENCN